MHLAKTLLAVSILALPVTAGPIHFLVAELPGNEVHNDSYVLSIDEQDTDRIDHARALADWVASGANPVDSPGATIVVSSIAAGQNGINRNAIVEGEPLWNWHPTGNADFADFTAEILDGWPTFVEQDVDGWIANTNGNVGFWGYTVVEELAPVPEPRSAASVTGISLAIIWLLRARHSRRRFPSNQLSLLLAKSTTTRSV